MSSSFSSVDSSQTLSPEQITEASRYLRGTRDALVDSVVGLSAQQWEFKPSVDCWSIAEIVEHVVLLERRVHAIVESICNAPEPPPDWEAAKMDASVLREVPNRSKKFQAPSRVCPEQSWSRTEGLERFFNSREQTIQLLGAPSLRGHVLPHPIMGLWDGYQWIVAAGAHSMRHTAQILEVKALPNFPQPCGAAPAPALE
jgi:DinB family protein